ncbi:MAG TPA: inorganic diphosphatase [Mucilaginibacter sp.]|nr:inorganic diphosphatase [Mucilaginibacter sp.]
MKYNRIPPLEKKSVNVVIETPRDSQNKFTYDPELRVFKLKKTLPMGTTFPFDFGFIPNTIGEDGDPLDVLVIMDQHAFPGCMVRCRALGILEAKQTEKNKKPLRNDRIVAVAECSVEYGNISNVKELNKNMVEEIENFFIDYNRHEGKKFKPIKWCNEDQALKMIKKHTIDQARHK